MSKNNKPRFIRKNGRIIPIGVRREARAIKGTARDVKRNPKTLGKALLTAGAAIAGGLALSFGAGRLSALSKFAKSAKRAEALSIGARIGDYGGKAGAGLVAGTAMTSFDRGTTKDEMSKLLNVGSAGTSPTQIALGLVGGYVFYRTQKRFVKWGVKGGKFPWKYKGV